MDKRHAITQNEGSHATYSHAKQVYIIQIYTQANREEYLAMIIKIIYNQENQSCQDERDKQQEECTCQGEQSDHTIRKVSICEEKSK